MVEPGRSVTLPPSPRPAPEGRENRRRGGLPLALGAGRSGKLVWKSSMSVGYRMSSLGTHDVSSGP